MMQTTFCPNCFEEGLAGDLCAACGYQVVSQGDNHMLLSPGARLNGRYLLGRVLGAGGFGITYLAKDLQSGEKRAIKEYLPSMLAVRDPESGRVYSSSKDNKDTFDHGLSVFNRESQVLRKFLGNPSIVQVFDGFEENGTAYFVMEFLDGVNLKALSRSMGDRLPGELVAQIVSSVGATLRGVHAQGLLHRDISPENIFVTKQGQIKLIDFGATRFFVGERSRSLSVILKPGFAPPEQYSSKGNQGPWTDIYALCATVYNLLTGRPVPDAPDRLGGIAMEPLLSLIPDADPSLAAAVERGLRLDYRERPQSVEEFLRDIGGAPAQSPAQSPAPAQAPAPARTAPPPQASPAPQRPAPVIQAKGTPFLRLFRKGAGADKWVIPKNMTMAIGRSSERCNIVLDEPNVSRVHCTILYDDKAGRFYLTDISSNGTFAGTVRLEKNKVYALDAGDEFCILSKDYTIKVGLE